MIIEAMKMAVAALEHFNTGKAPPPVEGEFNDEIEVLWKSIEKLEKQEPVAHLWECIGRWTAMIANDGEHANLAPPDWLVDSVKAATALSKREWIGLTEQDVHDAFNFTELVKQLSWEREPQEWCENFAAYCEAKLKEKNT